MEKDWQGYFLWKGDLEIYLLEGFGVKLGPPVAQEGVLRVAIEAAGEALEGALANHIRHIFEQKAAGPRPARIYARHAAVIMGEQMLAHLRPPHPRVAHVAAKYLPLPPPQTLLHPAELRLSRLPPPFHPLSIELQFHNFLDP